jgi:hypothetical protein
MNDDDSLRHYLAAYMKEAADEPAGKHLGEDEMIQLLREGKLAGSDPGLLHRHLADCPVCIGAFKDIRDFLEAGQVDEAVSGGKQMQAAWSQVRAALDFTARDSNVREFSTHGAPSEKSPARMFLPVALAASLLLVLSSGGIWIMELKGELKGRQRQMASEMATFADSYKQQQIDSAKQSSIDTNRQIDAVRKEYEARLEAERQRAESQKQSYLAQGAKTTSTQSNGAEGKVAIANVPIFDVFSDESVQRSAAGGHGNRIKADAGAQSYVLILNGGGQASYEDYSVEISNKSGRIIWRGTGLKRDQLGNFSLMVSKTATPSGAYMIRLYAAPGGKWQEISRYTITITD